jgi:hypothetical protein
MNVTKKISFRFLVLGLMLMLGCCKEKYQGPPYVHVSGWSRADAQTLAYLFQPMGTVFIYVDSVSGAYDTVTVIGRVTDTTEVWDEYITYTPLYYEEGQWQANYSSLDGG